MSEPAVVAFLMRKTGVERVRVTTDGGLVQVHAGRAHLTLRVPPGGSVEHALIAALRHGHDGVGQAAARALGEVGTAEAVQALATLAHGASHHSHVLLRRVALQAIGDIQSRLTHAAPGQLTMSTSPGGEVSLAAGGGEVSLTADPARTRT